MAVAGICGRGPAIDVVTAGTMRLWKAVEGMEKVRLRRASVVEVAVVVVVVGMALIPRRGL